jgi:hypothetical protein
MLQLSVDSAAAQVRSRKICHSSHFLQGEGNGAQPILDSSIAEDLRRARAPPFFSGGDERFFRFGILDMFLIV